MRFATSPIRVPRADAVRRSATLALLFVVIAVLGSCTEQTAPADGLPYTEHLVIEGRIVAGHAIDSIRVTRTLPLTVAYSPEAAAVSGAEVRVTVAGRTIPLSPIGGNYWSDTSGYIVRSGETYTLSVDWHGLHGTGVTRVPMPAEVTVLRAVIMKDSLSTGYPFCRVSFSVRAAAGDAYQLTAQSVHLADPGQDQIQYENDPPNYDTWDTGWTYATHLRTADTGRALLQKDWANYADTLRVTDGTLTVTTYDPIYLGFLKEYGSGRSDGFFGVSGTDPIWPVRGDAIGLFIGSAESVVPFTVK